MSASNEEDANEAIWRPLVAASGLTCVQGWPQPLSGVKRVVSWGVGLSIEEPDPQEWAEFQGLRHLPLQCLLGQRIEHIASAVKFIGSPHLASDMKVGSKRRESSRGMGVSKDVKKAGLA